MSAKPKYQITNKTASVSVGRKSYNFKLGTPEYDKAKSSSKSGDWGWLLSPDKKSDQNIRIREGAIQLLNPVSGEWEVPPVGWQELYKKYENASEVGALIPMYYSLSKANSWIQTQVLNGLTAGRFAVRPNGNLVMFRGFMWEDGVLRSFHDRSSWEFGKKRTESHYSTNVRETCTSGLHAAPWDTVRSVYGSKVIVEVDIEPCDVVAIPTQDSYPKIRCRAITPIRFTPTDPGYGMFAPPAVIEKIGDSSSESPAETKTTREAMKKTASSSFAKQELITKDGIPEKTGEIILDYTTDRITIPSQHFDLFGFVDKGSVKLFYSDPRARFMVVTKTTGVDDKYFRSNGVLKRPEWEWEHDASSNRSVSIRSTSLANCNIHGFDQYKVEGWIHNGHRYATIRPVK